MVRSQIQNGGSPTSTGVLATILSDLTSIQTKWEEIWNEFLLPKIVCAGFGFHLARRVRNKRSMPTRHRANDTTRTKQEGTALGAVAGGLLGATVGYLSGGTKGALIGAGAGAVVGGVAGHALGVTVAQRKLQYANAEDRLNGEINVTTKYNSDLTAYNANTLAQIGVIDREMRQLRARQRSHTVLVRYLGKKKSGLEAALQNGKTREAKMKEEYTALNQYVTNLKSARAGSPEKVAKLDSEVKLLRTNIEALDSNNRQMARMVDLTVRK